MLLKLLSQMLYITLDRTIFNESFSAERDYECQILLCQILFAFRHKSNTTLNNMGVLLKDVLIHSHACNFLHTKTSLCARCMHARHCACNLSSPGWE